MKVLPGSWREREALLVALIALHSFAVGLVLVMASEWAVRFGGWEQGGTYFFTRQGGVFHFVVAGLYLFEYFRHDSIVPIVWTKSIAVVFLLVLSAKGEPWLVPVSALIDGLMLISVLGVRALRRGRDAAGPP